METNFALDLMLMLSKTTKTKLRSFKKQGIRDVSLLESESVFWFVYERRFFILT